MTEKETKRLEEEERKKKLEGVKLDTEKITLFRE
jgi:hypothetical protein